MSKYAPLRRYLEGQRGNQITLSFDDVEDIIADALPVSARRHAAWWANDTNGRHVHANEWRRAGWKTSAVSLIGERVTFARSWLT